MTDVSRQVGFWERVAYGLGNFFQTVVTATAGLAMFFYTDAVGLSAALVGTLLLGVRLVDAAWDIVVGRWVDSSRGRFGQCRTFLLWVAPLMAVALVVSFTVPPFESTWARTVWVVLAYSALWWTYSLLHIPFQSLPALIAPDPEQRLRLLGVNAFIMFMCVVACGAGFPMLKDKLGGGNLALGFQRAAFVFGAIGLVLTWITFAAVRERVPATRTAQPDVRGDLRALASNRAWRVCLLGFGLLSLLIGLPLATGVYYFNTVLKAPQMIGPFMGMSGIGLMLGVVASGRLTRRFCKKRVLVLSSLLCGILTLGYLAVMRGPMPGVFALALITNCMLGIGAPISQSMLADTADAIERDTGRRVIGTLFATVGFGQKIGSGTANAVLGVVLTSTGYVAGQAVQPESAQWGIAILMGPINALVAFALAAVFAMGYPYGQRELEKIRDELARQRAAAAPIAS